MRRLIVVREVCRQILIGIRLGWYLHRGDRDGTTHLRRAKVERCADATDRQAARRISLALGDKQRKSGA